MARRQYLVAYDISDDKRRTRVFEALKDNGVHVQFSVFFCELSAQELAGLRGRLSGLINAAADQIILLDLGDAENPLERILECLGRRYHPPGRVQIV